MTQKYVHPIAELENSSFQNCLMQTGKQMIFIFAVVANLFAKHDTKNAMIDMTLITIKIANEQILAHDHRNTLARPHTKNAYYTITELLQLRSNYN